MARRRSHQLQELARIQVLNGSLHCGAEAACKHPKVQDVLRAMLLLLSVSRVGDADFLFDFSDNVCYRELGQRRVARRRRGLRLRSPIPVVTHDVDVDRRPRCENILAPPRSLSALPDGARWLSRIDSAPTIGNSVGIRCSGEEQPRDHRELLSSILPLVSLATLELLRLH